jgi:dsDNA-specific endonuclease/ATPase MutS2
MQEQLYSSANNELKAEEELHKDRIRELQQVIKELEKKMVTLEKSERTYDTLTGFVEKNREIYNPTEQAVEFKTKEGQMNDYVELLKLEIKKGKENEDNLLKINGVKAYLYRF